MAKLLSHVEENEELEEILFIASIPWVIWYDPRQNSFFLRLENTFGSMTWSPKGTLVGTRKSNNPEKYGCVKFGTL